MNNYKNTAEVLTDIYGSKFNRLNWINKKKFRSIEDIINYINDTEDTNAKFISMYNKQADNSIVFDKIFIDYDISTDDIISKELKLTAEEVDKLTEEEKATKLEEIDKVERQVVYLKKKLEDIMLISMKGTTFQIQ